MAILPFKPKRWVLCHKPASLEEAIGLMEAYSSAEAGMYLMPKSWLSKGDAKERPGARQLEGRSKDGRRWEEEGKSKDDEEAPPTPQLDTGGNRLCHSISWSHATAYSLRRRSGSRTSSTFHQSRGCQANSYGSRYSVYGQDPTGSLTTGRGTDVTYNSIPSTDQWAGGAVQWHLEVNVEEVHTGRDTRLALLVTFPPFCSTRGAPSFLGIFSF